MNKEFLKQLDSQNTSTLHVQIISLDINDIPMETIEGKTSTGSVNVDGASAVRRTCSLTMIAPLEDTIITDAYWCFNTKFKLRIGKENYIDPTYPDIIWFDMGVYVISTFSVSESTNSLTVNIQGKDKMCRLNGDIAGNLPSEVDFGQIETVHDTDPSNIIITLDKIPIKTIIRNAVREYGQERDENIIINDLDDYGYELWEYRGNEPMYYLMETNGNIKYMTIENDIVVYENGDKTTIDKVTKYRSTNTLDSAYNDSATLVTLGADAEEYFYVIKIDTDQTAGYHRIDLVYNTDLILKAGETITALLDKLKNMLGNFEYFYDLYGRFVFQKKKDYIQELFSTSTGALTTPLMYNAYYSYKFDDKNLFTSFSTSPNIGNVKNDFVVWGTRNSATGSSLSVHARCAIDKKPTEYVSPWERYQKIEGLHEDAMSEYVKGYYTKYIGENDEEPQYYQTWSQETGDEEGNVFTQDVNLSVLKVKDNNTSGIIVQETYNGETITMIEKDEDKILQGYQPLEYQYTLNDVTLNSGWDESDENELIKVAQDGYITFNNQISPLGNTTFMIKGININLAEQPLGLCYSISGVMIQMIGNIEGQDWIKVTIDENNVYSFTLTEDFINSFSSKACYLQLYLGEDSLTEETFNAIMIQSTNPIANTIEYSLNEGMQKLVIPYLKEQNLSLYSYLPAKRTYSTEDYDWRELIYQMAVDYLKHNQESDYLLKLQECNSTFVNGKTGYEQYYTDLHGFWRQLYCPVADAESAAAGLEYYDSQAEKPYWNKQIHTDPTALNFWFEFLDTGGELDNYSVTKIGYRPKVVNESSVTSIYYKGTPEVQFTIAPDNYKAADTAYTVIQVTQDDVVLFTRSSQGNSAIAKINELIQNHTACSQTVSISAIPIFYLQPNTRIYIKDYGDFTLDKISYNLSYSGTMSINATKIFKQFI